MVEFKGTHNSYDRLADSIRALMGAQVEVLVEIGGEKYTQSIHLLTTIARPHDNAAEGLRHPLIWENANEINAIAFSLSL